MKTFTIVLSLVLAATAAFGMTRFGDHPDRVVKGPAPRTCAGIRLARDHIGDAVKRFGHVERTVRIPDDDNASHGTVDYTWHSRATKVTASTHYVGDRESAMYSVEIENEGLKGPLSCVVALGTSLSTMQKRFGPAMYDVTRSAEGVISSFRVQWKDGTTLSVELVPGGRVALLHLMLPIE